MSRQSELIAIKGGSDWYDASIDFIKLPLSIDLDKAREEYTKWYKADYLLPMRQHKDYPSYLSFVAWLREYRGAVDPLPTELEVIDE